MGSAQKSANKVEEEPNPEKYEVLSVYVVYCCRYVIAEQQGRVPTDCHCCHMSPSAAVLFLSQVVHCSQVYGSSL
jgi:predicted DNA-binding ribbon-helix-helix protein